MQRPAQFAHEFGIGDRVRGAGVKSAGKFLILDARQYHARQVSNVNPTDILPSASDLATEEPEGQSAQDLEKTDVGTKNDAASQQHLAWFGGAAANEASFH